MKVFDYNNLPMLNIAWKVKGITKPSVWLMSTEDKEPIGITIKDDTMYGSLPMTLAEGIYGLKAAWLDDGKRKSAEVYELFKVTTDSAEITEDGEFDTVTLECESIMQIATANDGLSAYELSVLKGKTTLSENEWLDEVNGVRDFTTRGIAEKCRVEEELKRVESEALRQREWEFRKPLIDGVVSSTNDMLAKLNGVREDIDSKIRRMEGLIVMYQSTVANVQQVMERANTATAIASNANRQVENKIEELGLKLNQDVNMLFSGLEKALLPKIEKTTKAWIKQEYEGIAERRKSLKQIEQKLVKSTESLRPYIDKEMKSAVTDVKDVIMLDIQKQVKSWIMAKFTN